MKKNSLIKYSIFQSRRKFNPLTLFFNNENLSYEQFVNFLNSKMVDTPGIEYFERVKKEYLKITAKKEPVKEELVKEEPVKEELVKEEPVKEEQVFTSKKRSKRSRRSIDKKPELNIEDEEASI